MAVLLDDKWGSEEIQISGASLSVLSSLASQSSHALLSPLLSHWWLLIYIITLNNQYYSGKARQLHQRIRA
jgi:hypothetical protein